MGKCIDSLLSQTLGDIELILVDDASTDSSLDIMFAYQDANPRKIKVISSRKNGGAAQARNIGLENATGEYIGFVDSDDYINPKMYEEMLTACQETNSDMAKTDIKMLFFNREISFLGNSYPHTELSIINPREDKRFLVQEQPGVTSKLFKRELIGDSKFKAGLKWEDYPFTIPLMVQANQVVTVPGKNYNYNMHPKNTTLTDARKLNKNILDIFTCSDIVGNKCITPETTSNVREQIEYVQMKHCLGRLKEITSAHLPLQDKKELLTLKNELISSIILGENIEKIYDCYQKGNLQKFIYKIINQRYDISPEHYPEIYQYIDCYMKENYNAKTLQILK